MENNYAYIALFAVIGVAFAVVTMWLSWALRPSYNPTGAKPEPYECGEIPIGGAWKQFRVGYYIFALVFVVFDVEVAFIFPWAKELQYFKVSGQGLLVFGESMVFMHVLFVSA